MNSIPVNYSNIQSFINELNSSEVPYLVLRNYDNLLEESIYMDGHGDVDILCNDSLTLAKFVKASSHSGHIRQGKHDLVHYFININGQNVSLDLRYVGDGYYCKKWQDDMLARRTMYNGFFVPHPEDYFYSLIYHAVFQKKKFSKDYKVRLKKMGEDLGLVIEDNSIFYFVQLLETFMRDNSYFYEYPKDKYVPLQTQHIIDKSLFLKNPIRWWQHFLFETKVKFIETLVNIKHSFKSN